VVDGPGPLDQDAGQGDLIVFAQGRVRFTGREDPFAPRQGKGGDGDAPQLVDAGVIDVFLFGKIVVKEDLGHLVVGKLVQAAQEIVLFLVDPPHQVEDDRELFVKTRAHAVDQYPLDQVQADMKTPGHHVQVAGHFFQINLAQKNGQRLSFHIVVHEHILSPRQAKNQDRRSGRAFLTCRQNLL